MDTLYHGIDLGLSRLSLFKFFLLLSLKIFRLNSKIIIDNSHLPFLPSIFRSNLGCYLQQALAFSSLPEYFLLVPELAQWPQHLLRGRREAHHR